MTCIKQIVDPIQQRSAADLTCRLSILEALFKQALTLRSQLEEFDAKEITRNTRRDKKELFIEARVCI